MTREEVIDLLTLARVYDARVTTGKAETAAWYLAVGRLPFNIAQAAVTAHYTAPVEPGAQYPRIAPGHITAYHQAHNRPYDQPVPQQLPAAPADPGYAAECREQIDRVISEAADRWTLDDDREDEYGPKWRPGMDKQELARQQAEAYRRQRTGEPS